MKKKTGAGPRKKHSASSSTIRNIWMISREYEGIAGAGGVKDVCRQSAEAFARNGHKVHVVLPCYGFIEPEANGFHRKSISFTVDMSYVGKERREQLFVWEKEQAGVRLYLLDGERFLEKNSVYTYSAADEQKNPFNRQGAGHFDYFATNVLLQKGALALIIELDARPDIIHCHDGHTAMLPAMIREIEGFRHYFRRSGCVVTIHNAGQGYHQEVGDLPFAQSVSGLPQRVIYGSLLNGAFDPLLAAADYAMLNTVSENYAAELQQSDEDRLTGWLGHKLLARGVQLQGITNGINQADFDPRYPEKLGLAAAFDPLRGELAGKKACRKQLSETLGHAEPNPELLQKNIRQSGYLEERPVQALFTFVGRLTSQKGVDKLIDALESLMSLDDDFQVVLLGTGSPEIEESLQRLTGLPANKGRIAFLRGYDKVLANRIYAAGDFFLVPSQYEPCGLTDFIAQLFANLPIVHHTGGLVKVREGVNGFAYAEHSSAALMGAMQRAIKTFRTDYDQIKSMQQQAIKIIAKHYTWDVVNKNYLELYRQARMKAEN